MRGGGGVWPSANCQTSGRFCFFKRYSISLKNKSQNIFQNLFLKFTDDAIRLVNNGQIFDWWSVFRNDHKKNHPVALLERPKSEEKNTKNVEIRRVSLKKSLFHSKFKT